ncbi:MAG: DUF1273 family protein [Clostridia bacterium]|nr:DUF1273 family protein [Clostridia bacterium]
MTKTCCFTGHRALPAENGPEYAALLDALSKAVDDAVSEGCSRFVVGGAKGFDLLAGKWILARKKTEPAITLSVYVPFRGQDAGYAPDERAAYRALLEGADEVVVLSETYYPGCMRARNARMVADADLCIAYVRKKPSGSAQTMRMAESAGLTVLRI